MSLFNESGHAKIDDRNKEAERLIDEISVNLEPLQPHELRFLQDMSERVADNKLFCSVKQLFWLRDLYEKYCL